MPKSSRDRRTLARWVRRFVALAVAGALMSLVVVAALPKPVVVETAAVQPADLEVTVDEYGRTRVKDRYVISAPLTGNLARLELEPGDEVKPGDVVARIVPLTAPLLDARTRREAEARVRGAEAARSQARAQIERARTAEAFAKTQAERTRALVSSGVAVAAELDRAALEERAREAERTSAEFGAKVADHELTMARAALEAFRGARRPRADEQLVVPSPVRGRVLRVIQQSEGVVQAGAALVELGDPSALEIVVDVLTSDAVRIPPSARARIVRWGGEPLDGRVRLVEPSAFTRLSALGVEEQRVNAVIDLDSPYDAWRALMDGFRVEARIVVWSGESVLAVPASALFRRGDGFAVFVVRGERAAAVRVEIGRQNGLLAEVTGGLQAGDRVVVHPSDRVVDGVRVEAR